MAGYSQFDVNYQIPNFDIASQKKETSDLLGRYSSAIGGMESIPALYSRYASQFGIPDLSNQNIQLGEIGEQLRSQYLGMPQQVADTSRESLMTAGQKQGLVQSKQAPLQESMTEVGRQQAGIQNRLTSAQNLTSQMMGYEMAQQERSLLPFEKEFSTLEQLQAREFSGYTFREEQELDRLLANAKNGLDWTNAEKDRANQLAMKEMEYRNALEVQKMKNNAQAPTSTTSGDWFYDQSSGWVPVID